MKLYTLLENTSYDADLHTEHGLSLYLEACGHKILFDAGQTDAFAYNAKLLGVDLSAADIAILSHGHYDHGGGLKRFLDINTKASGIQLTENEGELTFTNYNGESSSFRSGNEVDKNTIQYVRAEVLRAEKDRGCKLTAKRYAKTALLLWQSCRKWALK